jgi:NAD(P)-dependent dehydrogenase (short-subunit alcohol dehydrogenase family)
MKDFAGRTALITGAGNGFGAEFAKEATARGMKLVLVDIDEADVQRTLATCQELGAEGIALGLDVSLYENVKTMVKTAVDTYGTIDLLINDAGVAVGGLVWETPVQDYEWTLAVNVMAQVYAMHEVIPIMRAQGNDCHIVNVASVAGVLTSPGLSCYHMSKHASVALSESVYYDLQAAGATIGMSVYCPGFVQTDLHHYERHRPERFAQGDDPYYQSEPYKRVMARSEHVIKTGIPIDSAGMSVFIAIEENQFYILTHPQYFPIIGVRCRDILEGRVPSIANMPG